MRGDATVDRSSTVRRPAAFGGGRSVRVLLLALASAMALLSVAATSAQASNKRPHGEVIATCTSITFVFTGFPNAPNNTVTEKVTIHNVEYTSQTFEFNGPEGSNTIPITVPPGEGKVDGKAVWHTNGFNSSYDIATALNCSDPAFTIEKEQEIAGSGEGFTKSELVGNVGQTVDYKVLVTNTGNVPLTFSKFIDTQCSNIAGGPVGALEPGQSTTYTCNHLLTEADKNKSPTYENDASVLGTPPKGEGGAKRITSNTVVVRFKGPHERPNGSVIATCSSITFSFTGFPNAPNNTVTEKVTIHGKHVLTYVFHFNGPTGSNTIPITVPPGLGQVDGKAVWNTNGFKGGYDISTAINCPATPNFGVEKLQKIQGGAEGFTHRDDLGGVRPDDRLRDRGHEHGERPADVRRAHGLGLRSRHDRRRSGSDAVEPGIDDVHVQPPAHRWRRRQRVIRKRGQRHRHAAPEEGSPLTRESNTVVASVTAAPEPAFEITKYQRVEGLGSFSTGEQAAEEGQLIEYSILVRNTGNVPLTFSELTDPGCDQRTIEGGPGATPVKPGEWNTFTCSQVLDEAEIATFYENTAEISATPPVGDGPTTSQTSNTVRVNVGPKQ